MVSHLHSCELNHELMPPQSCDHHLPHQNMETRRLWVVFWLTFFFMLVEVAGGLLTHSLTLLADSGHMFTDVAALGLSLFALWFSTSKSSLQKTYGYYRLEILIAFINGLLLAGLSLWIVWEAFQRLSQEAHPVLGGGMLIVALIGLCVNLFSVFWLHDLQSHNLNIKGAYLHILGDLIGSVATVLAAVLVICFGWIQADSILSMGSAVLIVISAIRLVLESVNILLEASPHHINVKQVEAVLTQQSGVLAVHDLHIWTITSGCHALSAHITVEPDYFTPAMTTLLEKAILTVDTFHHLTLQLEVPLTESA